MFRVDVSGVPDLHLAGQQVIFHGINKSGSLTLTNVLADARSIFHLDAVQAIMSRYYLTCS